jgi:hypothetical protein
MPICIIEKNKVDYSKPKKLSLEMIPKHVNLIIKKEGVYYENK